MRKSDKRSERNEKRHRNTIELPDFTQRPTTRETRPPVKMQVGPELYYSWKWSKWDKMAGAMREIMENKQGKDGNPKATKLRKFSTFAMRGFGGSPRMLAVGSFGGDLIASVKRCINARGNNLIASGVRFPITYRLLKAEEKVDFGTVHTGKEVEGSTALGDFPY